MNSPSEIEELYNYHNLLSNQSEQNKQNITSNSSDEPDMGLQPHIWGPAMWKALHCVSFAYPTDPTPKDKTAYKTFFTSLGSTLPCEGCRVSYSEFIKTKPTELTDKVLESRANLTKWLYDIHEKVNAKLGVKYNITYDDVVEQYESFRATCNKVTNQCMEPPKQDVGICLEYKIECNVIPYESAKKFELYAQARGFKGFDNIEQYKDVSKLKNTHGWYKRNETCQQIIKSMRENKTESVEPDGKFIGLPTIQELELISHLCSNLKGQDFKELTEKVEKFKPQTRKVYKFSN